MATHRNGCRWSDSHRGDAYDVPNPVTYSCTRGEPPGSIRPQKRAACRRTEFFSAARSIETVAAELERTKVALPPTPVIWERFFNAHVVLDLLVEQGSREALGDFVAALLEAERGELREPNVAQHLRSSRRAAREQLRRELG